MVVKKPQSLGLPAQSALVADSKHVHVLSHQDPASPPCSKQGW